MSAKVLIFCVFVIFIRDTLTQCIRSGAGSYKEGLAGKNNRIGYGASPCSSVVPATPPIYPSSLAVSGNLAETFGPGYPVLDFNIVSAKNGGSFKVHSSSAIAPSSISVQSENVIEGTLSLNGMLPFLSTVALDGALPSFGAGGVAYRCGEGIAILNENIGTSDTLKEEADDNNRFSVNQSKRLSKLGKEFQC